MQFISVRELRLNPGDIWKNLGKEGELILTSRGTPIALLTSVNTQNLEDTLSALRRVKAQIAVSRMREEAARKGLDRLTTKEIQADIDAIRRKRTHS